MRNNFNNIKENNNKTFKLLNQITINNFLFNPLLTPHKLGFKNKNFINLNNIKIPYLAMLSTSYKAKQIKPKNNLLKIQTKYLKNFRKEKTFS